MNAGDELRIDTGAREPAAAWAANRGGGGGAGRDADDAELPAVSQGRTGTFTEHRRSDGLSDTSRGGGHVARAVTYSLVCRAVRIDRLHARLQGRGQPDARSAT